MVVQISAHPGQVALHGNAQRLQMRRGPQPRAHQDGGRAKRPRAEHHLAPCRQGQGLASAQGMHRPGTPLVQTHTVHRGVGEDMQIGATARRRQVRLGGAVAFAVFLGDLVQAHALLRGAVEIVGARQTGLHTGFDKALRERVGVAQVGHVQRPGLAMQIAAEALIALGPDEPGQHILPAPARVAHGGPGVVVLRMATHVDHGVGRTAAAERAAARLQTTATLEAWLRFGVQHL